MTSHWIDQIGNHILRTKNTNPIILLIPTTTDTKTKIFEKNVHTIANHVIIFNIDHSDCPDKIMLKITDHLINDRFELNDMTILLYQSIFDFDLSLFSRKIKPTIFNTIIYHLDKRIIGLTINRSRFQYLFDHIQNQNNTKNIYQHMMTIDRPINISDELSRIRFDQIFNTVTQYIADHQIWTIGSITRILSNPLNMIDCIERMITIYGSDVFRQIVKHIINIKHPQISDTQLQEIRKQLQENNQSIRQMFYLEYGLRRSITKNELIVTLKKYNISTDCYTDLDKNKCIDLIDEIFAPLEHNNPLCIIIPAYNNASNYRALFDSIYCQNKSNYRIIYTDDCSTDGSLNEVTDYVDQIKQNSRTLILKQIVRQRQCAGRYIGYHMAFDDEIILMVDGDDQLADHTFEIINNVYDNNHIVCTYGGHSNRYVGTVDPLIRGNGQFPRHIIEKKDYRYFEFITGHLRTGYAKLFKSIRLTDLLDHNNQFLHILTDCAEMIPVLEMATVDHDINIINNLVRKEYHLPVNDLVYIYNYDNSIKYPTSYVHRNDKENYYKQYREDAHLKLRRHTKYQSMISIKPQSIEHKYICIKNNNSSDINIVDIVDIVEMVQIMENYNLDCLIDRQKTRLTKTNESCLYLTAIGRNHKIDQMIEVIINPDIDQIMRDSDNLVVNKEKYANGQIVVVGYFYSVAFLGDMINSLPEY
jgi:glycosyltransferase involved in cell wall biosynthesis